MTKILSIEERVEEYKDTNYHTGEKPNQNAEWVRQALTAQRTALLTELRDSGLLEEKEEHLDWCKLTGELEYSSCGCWKDHNTLARAIKAHLDELIKSNSV